MFPTTPLVKLGDNHFSKVSSLTSGSEIYVCYVREESRDCMKICEAVEAYSSTLS
jgi:hypothetical protein